MYPVDLRILELLGTNGVTVPQIEARLMPLAAPPTLRISDYRQAGEQVETARRLLTAALDGRERGVNLLIHGPTGSGKTELARVLAKAARARLREVEAALPNGFSPGPFDRLWSVLLGQRMLARQRTVLIFDELEDLFDGNRGRGRASARMAKAWFNRLLEENAVPTIWITNDAAGLDPAFLRRFSMSIELEPLDRSRREQVLQRAAGKGQGVETADAKRVAERYPVSAAELQNAVHVARLAGGGRLEPKVLEGLLGSSLKLLTGEAAPQRVERTAPYRLDLVNASLDLGALATRLTTLQQESGGVTLCLHGPPGTGKSEYVRHLAERLGRRLVTRKVSDIESKWVGDAEKNLAAAFAEAEREGALLLFDEADSFLRERTRATHRWEVTLTNEFLQLLEGARGLVACTTNLYEELDKAVFRRFALRIGFDYLKPEQAMAMFENGFGALLGGDVKAAMAGVGPRLTGCGPLAPGDFAVVERRARLLGQPVTADWLIGELELEAGEREGPPPPVVGFRREETGL